MSPFPQVLQFLVVAVAGWINQQPRDVIDSLGASAINCCYQALISF